LPASLDPPRGTVCCMSSTPPVEVALHDELPPEAEDIATGNEK